MTRPDETLQVPLQCPYCKAHGWVTRITTTLRARPFALRCTNCDHEWPLFNPSAARQPASAV